MRPTLRFLGAYTRLHLQTALEYRLNFIIQSVFMIVNNIMFMLVWQVVFGHVDTINGWGKHDFFLLFGMASLCFGIISFFLGNWKRINEVIASGELDFYLALPKDALVHILISKSSFSAMGDIIFGITVALAVLPFTFATIGWLVLFAVLGALIWLNIMVIFDCLAFWLGRTEGINSVIFNLTLSMTTYPSSIYGEGVRFVFFFIIPIFFINNTSVMIIKDFSWPWLLGMLGVAVLTTLITQFVFRRGVRRYESGNLIGARV